VDGDGVLLGAVRGQYRQRAASAAYQAWADRRCTQFLPALWGLLAFGVVGLFVGPVVLAVAYTLRVGERGCRRAVIVGSNVKLGLDFQAKSAMRPGIAKCG
jgi:hypothetical protein